APSVKLSNGLTCAKNQPTSAGNHTPFSRIRGATEGGRATVNEQESEVPRSSRTATQLRLSCLGRKDFAASEEELLS
ncbi:MAG: hypothetical protein ACRDP9_02755, partial [Kribbellaceae bacterium]